MYGVNKFSDYVLYPLIIYKAGLVLGGFINVCVSVAYCLLLLRYYDLSKKDWFGIETIRDLKDYSGANRIGGIISWLLQRSKAVSFFVLSVCYDPFITTVWLRSGRFCGMTNSEWKIFWGSVLIGNMTWAVACWLGIGLFTSIYRALSQ